jgi:hypothetical protein
MEHWLRAHELFAEDVPQLERAHALRYEDLVADPDGTLGRVFAFLGLEDPSPGRAGEAGINTDNFEDRTLKTGVNDKYFEEWRRRRSDLPRRFYYDAITWRYERQARAFGYSLRDPQTLREPTLPLPGLGDTLAAPARVA